MLADQLPPARSRQTGLRAKSGTEHVNDFDTSGFGI
jgi:hypothetical protein